MQNTVPQLLNALRLTLHDVAAWTGVSRGLAAVWVTGHYEPKPPNRARLVRGVRTHAKSLQELADKVEREAKRSRRRSPRSR